MAFCGGCGTARAPEARFCGNCGAPAVDPAAGPVTEAAAERTSVLHRPEPPHPVAPPAQDPPTYLQPPQGPPTYAQPPQGQPTYAQPPYAQPPYGAPLPGAAPVAGPGPAWAGQPAAAPQPGGVPWATTGGSSSTGRDSMDALLGGDWTGAAIAAAAATGLMAALALISLLLLGASDAGTHELISATAMLVCAAFGGDLFASDRGGFGDGDGFGLGSASVGALPLTLTLVGLTVLVVVFLRRTRGAPLRELLLQAVRTTLVLAALTLVLALVSRVQTGSDPDLFSAPGRVGASVPSSVVGAVLFAVAALGLAVLLTGRAGLPQRVLSLRTHVGAPLLAAAAVFAVGLLAALAGLVYTLSTEDDQLEQLGVALLALPNLALGSVLLTMGVPLRAEGSFFGFGDGSSDVNADGSSTVSLLSLTEQSAFWWLAPVVLALVILAVVVMLIVRQHTLQGARREALRFAGCLAVLAAVAALLLRISGSGSSSASSLFSGEGSILFNPVVAAVVAGLWGLAAAVAAPQLATKASGGLVSNVRRRFGTAPLPPAAPPTTAAPGAA